MRMQNRWAGCVRTPPTGVSRGLGRSVFPGLLAVARPLKLKAALAQILLHEVGEGLTIEPRDVVFVEVDVDVADHRGQSPSGQNWSLRLISWNLGSS